MAVGESGQHRNFTLRNDAVLVRDLKKKKTLEGYFHNLITSKRRSLDASIHFDGKN
jgi:hypothetical protein